MAVPGDITSPLGASTNNLVKAGAAAVTSAHDVLDIMGMPVEILERSPQLEPATSEEARILELLNDGITATDALLPELMPKSR